jgi:hypothetical protein
MTAPRRLEEYRDHVENVPAPDMVQTIGRDGWSFHIRQLCNAQFQVFEFRQGAVAEHYDVAEVLSLVVDKKLDET